MLEKFKEQLRIGHTDSAIAEMESAEFVQEIKAEDEVNLYGLLNNELTKKKLVTIIGKVSIVLAQNVEVSNLKLGGNNLSSENDTKVISDNLKLQNTGLKTLDFSNNGINSQEAISKLTIMLKDINLEKISFRNNRIKTEDALKALIGALRGAKISYLNLSYNEINSLELVKVLIDEIIHGDNNIDSLDLSHNGIGKNKYSEALSVFGSLKQNSKIKNLYLAGNSINTTHFISSFVEALEWNQTLEYLDLGDNELNEVGALTFLARGVAKSGLKNLNLQNNGINKKESILNLITPLSGNKQLTTLNLSNNGLNDIEAIKALSALKSTNITTLDLSFNDINSKEKLEALKIALKDTKVTKVILGATNVITDISNKESGVFGLDKDFIEENNLRDKVTAIEQQLQENQNPKSFAQKALGSTSRRMGSILRSPTTHSRTVQEEEKIPLLTGK